MLIEQGAPIIVIGYQDFNSEMLYSEIADPTTCYSSLIGDAGFLKKPGDLQRVIQPDLIFGRFNVGKKFYQPRTYRAGNPAERNRATRRVA